MPPFKSGLLKRKVNAPSAKVGSIKVTSDDESSNSSEEQELIQDQGGINPEGDATDSENEEENSAVSDEEQDEVLYQDEAEWSAGSGAEGDAASADRRHSTDLEDSDASDSDAEASNNIREDEDNDAEDETTDDEVDETESSKHTKSHPHADTNNKIVIKSRQNSRHKKEDNKKESDNTSMDRLAGSVRSTTLTPVVQKDEYESGDTSDEEDRRSTVGDVPMWWYREYPHLGYDLAARRQLRPPQRDAIDDFLKSCSEPEFWRTVRDPATGQDVLLSRADLALLQRLQQSRVPNADHDEYEEWVEWFSGSVLAAPVRAFPEHKRSFVPSRADARAVARLAHALRMGWAKTRRQQRDERRANKEKRFYDLWGSGADAARAPHRPIAAPRRALPTHAESYNPPPEYLLDDKEMKEWERQAETPWKRKYTFLPTCHGALRSVPAYPRFVRERFLRCLDLYLAPRAIKMRLTISPEELVPRLPAPRDLQPFPTREALVLRGHAAAVRSAAFDPSGQYVVSGGDDCTVRVWEAATGRCVRTTELAARVSCVAWAPGAGLALLAAGAGARLLLLSAAGAAAQRAAAATDAALHHPPPDTGHQVDSRTASCVTWDAVSGAEWARGVRLALTHFRPVTHVSWHARGDYVCVTLADAASRSVLVHQLSRRRSQLPFARAKGLVQAAVFHPTKPVLFVATQRCVRMYDLVKQELVRKLSTGAQWVSCLAPHPAGDNLLVGSYDRKCIWFDLELSGKPYQTLRLHGGAVRALAFHARYPLFASAGDDDNIVVSHGMVYNDLLQNPLLVPLKQLAGGARRDALCVLALAWHPAQPWLLAACADHTLRLYS